MRPKVQTIKMEYHQGKKTQNTKIIICNQIQSFTSTIRFRHNPIHLLNPVLPKF